MHYKRLIIIYFLVCWGAASAIVMFHPMPDISPQVQRITFYDKAAHLVIFFVIAFLFALLFNTFEKTLKKYAFAAGAAISIFFAFLSEYAQVAIPGRSPGVLDFISGLAGALIGSVLFLLWTHKPKPRLLLHVCCATCAGYVREYLSLNYRVVMYYFNPCIHPREEYKKRLKDVKELSRLSGSKLLIGPYTHKTWRNKIKGREHDPEGGERCWLCYRDRLENTAKKAAGQKIRHFASTLSVSPHKKAAKINIIGKEIAQKHGLHFLEADFKKNNGFKRSMEISKKYDFYRQKYCGCEFSRRF